MLVWQGHVGPMSNAILLTIWQLRSCWQTKGQAKAHLEGPCSGFPVLVVLVLVIVVLEPSETSLNMS